ncbi:MAG: redoxin [Oceanospirillaceae bacterium]|uniref:TlpA family protein disulfide reductase n=3 Tax=unclassified Thalassolituus TaxID=2624967 RepID=UPI000C3D9879|nr:TlpA disulfide reductase family protein [Thalassolituus sp. UBA6592]MAS26538.1 redoxin [Oceanospirillaceae bacterium]MAY00015.1 redoxin [Oceanospirillaceae bacterium]MBS51541.1 redoxin [Oceanospirillaceae bacterium]|tara:strand:- start:3564 stop:4082 length:519 start_codon:yes stop_codon:yes gene_type:complete
MVKTLLSAARRHSFLLISALIVNAAASADSATDKAPVFTLPVLDGSKNVSLADYQGQVVYVDFWASWCGPCRKSLPFIEGVRADLKDQGFEVLAVNLDEETAPAYDFLQQHPLSFPILHDPSGDTPDSFGLRGMPTSYLIDRDGNIHSVHEGFRTADAEKIRAEITALVSKK